MYSLVNKDAHNNRRMPDHNSRNNESTHVWSSIFGVTATALMNGPSTTIIPFCIYVHAYTHTKGKLKVKKIMTPLAYICVHKKGKLKLKKIMIPDGEWKKCCAPQDNNTV